MCVVVEDGAPVLRPNVRPLPINFARVVVFKEDSKKLFIGDFLWVIRYFNGFRVSRLAGAYICIRRKTRVAARISNAR